jgi:hypothetical protein
MYTPNCDVFAVGSYPFKDPVKACRRILGNPYVLLHWPQLPKRSKKEAQVHQTYAAIATPNDDFPKGAAAGWTAMWRLLKKPPRRRGAARKDTHFKTQIAGPITMFAKLGWGPDRDTKLLQFMSLWLKHAYWQIDQIKDHGFRPVVVLDEPLLPNFLGPPGSPKARKTLRLLGSLVKRLKKRGAVIGVHCCNRISPVTLIDLGVDLIHFDAYYFPTQISRNRVELQRFLMDGGIVAWGAIPTNETLTETARVRVERGFHDILLSLEGRGLPLRKVLAQSMVAPTCGMGALTPESSDRIMEFATALSRSLKSRYKLD